MSKRHDTFSQVRVNPELLPKIDGLRKEYPFVPSFTAYVNHLIKRGIEFVERERDLSKIKTK